MPRHPDLVGRDFTATAPNQLWVTDLTFVPTWAGVAYVCFIIDAYSRAIVGWRVASHMRTTIEVSRHHGTTRLQIRSGDAEIMVVGTAQGVKREVRPRIDRTPGTWAWLTHHLDPEGATMVQSEQ
ncbi:MAG: family transposase, partial [Nocardioides sp.]|jgi:transposase InsO family protein|nr:family transposase [Nocardioides sp.]